MTKKTSRFLNWPNLVAVLMIIFGALEIFTGFSHNFVGISTAEGNLSTYSAATIGALYAVAGFLVMTRRKIAIKTAISLLFVVIAGRIILVLTGVYPLSSVLQDISISIGNALAVVFAVYLIIKLNPFK